MRKESTTSREITRAMADTLDRISRVCRRDGGRGGRGDGEEVGGEKVNGEERRRRKKGNECESERDLSLPSSASAKTESSSLTVCVSAPTATGEWRLKR